MPLRSTGTPDPAISRWYCWCTPKNAAAECGSSQCCTASRSRLKGWWASPSRQCCSRASRPCDRGGPFPLVTHGRLAEHDADRRQPPTPALPRGHGGDRRRVEPAREVRPDLLAPGHPARHGVGEGVAEVVDAVLVPTVDAIARSTPLPVPLDPDAPVLGHQAVTRLEPRQAAVRRAARIRTIHAEGEPIGDVLHVERRRLRADGQQLPNLRGESDQVVPARVRRGAYTPRGSLAQEEPPGAAVPEPEREVADQPRRARVPPGPVAGQGQPGVVDRRIDAVIGQIRDQLPAVVEPAVEDEDALREAIAR